MPSKKVISRAEPKRSVNKKVKFALILLLILLTCVIAYGIYLYIKANSAMTEAYEVDEREKSDLRVEVVDPKFDNVSILLMGVDENKNRQAREVARTDALILATLNKEEKSIKLLSIPRDTYVYIPEVGYEDKINHAHAFGGTYAAIETVEHLLNIPVDYYIKLNFHAFVDVIDAIGGVEVEVPYEVQESNSYDERNSIHLFPGKQILKGEEALALARTRKKDSDFERGKRQLEIINSVINKATSIGSLFKYDDIIDAVGNNMSTNMRFSEMKNFFSYATHGSKLNVEKLSLSGIDYQPNNIYYWKLDEESLIETINELKVHLELSAN